MYEAKSAGGNQAVFAPISDPVAELAAPSTRVDRAA